MSKTFEERYEENKKYIIGTKKCELCINKHHTVEEHRILYNRAYSRVRDYNRTENKYRRGCYKNRIEMTT